MNDDRLQQLWKTAPLRKEPLDMQAIMTRSRGLQTRVRIRNVTETAACAWVILTFADIARAAAAQGDAWGVTAGVLEVLGTLYVLVGLWRRGGNLPPPAMDASTSVWLSSHRAELERQRAALGSVLGWYVLPFVPGVVVFSVAPLFRAPAHTPWLERVAACGATLLFVAAVMAFVVWLNKRAARALSAKLAELDSSVE